MTCTLYNLRAGVSYECQCNDINQRAERVLSEEARGVYATTCFGEKGSACVDAVFTVVLYGCLDVVQFSIGSGPRTLADIINTWNAKMLKRQHVVYMTGDDCHSDRVVLQNHSEYDIVIYCMSSMLGIVNGLSSLVVPVDMFAWGKHYTDCPHNLDAPIVVPQPVACMQVTATLYRKHNAGYYVLQEVVVLPAGFYVSADALVAALNMAVGMRGERRGFIYRFVLHKGLLAAEAAHKQPEPSSVQFRPLNYALGLHEADNLPLRTGKRLYFPGGLSNVLC